MTLAGNQYTNIRTVFLIFMPTVPKSKQKLDATKYTAVKDVLLNYIS